MERDTWRAVACARFPKRMIKSTGWLKGVLPFFLRTPYFRLFLLLSFFSRSFDPVTRQPPLFPTLSLLN